MKRFLALSLVVFVAFGALSPVAASENAPFSSLKAWVGHYPFDKIDGRDVFAVEPFLAKVKKALGDDRYDVFVKDYQKGVTFPVEEKDGVVLFSFCKAHECADNSVFIYATLADSSLDICWMQRAEINGFWLTDKGRNDDIGIAGCLDDVPFGLYDMHKKD